MTEAVSKAKAAGKKALYRTNKDLSLSRAIGDTDLKCGSKPHQYCGAQIE